MESIATRATAENVRSELGRKNLKRGALMPVLGLSYTAINQRFSGHKPFNVAELELIADFLDVPMSKLIDQSHYRIAS